MKYAGINVKGTGFSIGKAKTQSNAYAKKAVKRTQAWAKRTKAF